MYKCVTVLFIICVSATIEVAGQSCTKNGVSGTCILINDCPVAIEDIKKRRNPQICGFQGADPIVCCVSDAPAQVPTTAAPRPALTTSTSRPTSTTEYEPPTYDYVDTNRVGGCEPLSPTRTAERTNQKAWNKCLEYQEQLVYPCEKGMSLTNELTRVDKCSHKVDELIIGGVDAAKREFPHMVLLGYGDTAESAQWLCGGSLISERFILTAGHCSVTREAGEVKYVVIGALKRKDIDSSKVYNVQRIIRHPEYKPPVKYHDIALLETDKDMDLKGQLVVPACLDVGGNQNEDKASATGWGATEYRGGNADNLQKVTLQQFTTDECSKKFPKGRHMAEGFDTSTQICYGDKTKSKDTCQGDSGGPLQIKNLRIKCMYTIIGVTSFGKACGWIGDPGIYTKVAAYVPWIEAIVWP